VKYRLTVNDRVQDVEAPAEMPLLWVLREQLGLVGTKFGCGKGLCGACTVHIDGVAQRSCMLPIDAVAKSRITTIERIGETDVGARLQAAWLKIDVMQCGYCQAGQIMSAAALLQASPKPDDDAIDTAMAGNICRCACYNRIQAAIRIAAGVARETDHVA
jgi:isoquinoline 1-oxidoreductase alpha subunit